MINYFKQNKFFIITSFLALIGLFSILHTEKAEEWSLTLDPLDKKPFGTCVFDSLMRFRFGERYKKSDLTLYQINENSSKSKTLILVTNDLRLTPDDIHEIKVNANNGDRYIFASNYYSKEFCDTFNIKQESAPLDIPFWRNYNNDSILTNFDLLSNDQTVDSIPVEIGLINGSFSEHMATSKVSVKDQFSILALKTRIGKGSVDICSSPLFFTNYFLLKKQYYAITNHILSNINTDEVVYAAKYVNQQKNEASIFKNLLTNSALKSMFYLTLLLLLLFFIFGAKRKQRIIPIIEPLRNTSLDFIKLIGRMYFLKENHSDLCMKKFSYLKEHLLQKHFIRFTEENPDLLYQTIATKTGIEQKEVVKLFTRINQITKNKINISKEELHQLIKSMERFY
jgi:hypothetical protein